MKSIWKPGSILQKKLQTKKIVKNKNSLIYKDSAFLDEFGVIRSKSRLNLAVLISPFQLTINNLQLLVVIF